MKCPSFKPKESCPDKSPLDMEIERVQGRMNDTNSILELSCLKDHLAELLKKKRETL